MKKIVFQICISVGYIGFPIFTMQEFGKGKELNNEQLQITMPDENILKNRLELHWSDFVKKTNFIKLLIKHLNLLVWLHFLMNQ